MPDPHPETTISEGIAHAHELGSTVYLRPMDLPEGRIAVVSDPEGNKPSWTAPEGGIKGVWVRTTYWA